jgi:hypothetical protein
MSNEKGNSSPTLLRKETQGLNIFNEINLNSIYDKEEINELFQDKDFINYWKNGSKNDPTKNEKDILNNKIKHTADRMSLILKFIQISIEKLNKHKEAKTAKGLEWYLFHLCLGFSMRFKIL